MEIIADVLLGIGALSAGLYCMVLSRRLSKFTNLEQGMGSAIAVLSAQVDDLTKVLVATQRAAAESSDKLSETTERAESAAARLDQMLVNIQPISDFQAKEPRVVRRNRRSAQLN